ncbi:hypothetical protein KJ359_003365 [Pestalotiopsis sp. 9143b]|nr:hypothetical protein KJ359_003365 [Pestalotiopsis sp. 9143b]
MLWHDKLSLDNILVDVETGHLTGILGWECTNCLPVPLGVNMPAFLYEGRYRPKEPEIEPYTVYIPPEDSDDDDEEEGDEEDGSPGTQTISSSPENPPRRRARGQMKLKENYWRALRDYELSHLREVFLREMFAECREWYWTWKRTKVHKDYEAAVQHCDNKDTIHRVERWCDVVEAAIVRGQEIRPPHVRYPLAQVLTEGPDWAHLDDLDEGLEERIRPFREQRRRVEEWEDDVEELEAAKKELSNAKRVRTRFNGHKKAVEKKIATAQEAIDKANQDIDDFEELDEDGLDVQQLMRLRQDARDDLADAVIKMDRYKRTLGPVEAKARSTDDKWEAAKARELAAMEQINKSEWFQAFDKKRTFIHETWKNLEEALNKAYPGGTWWKHHLEPLGWCPRKKNRDAGLLKSDDESSDGEDSDPMVIDPEEEDLSEEE